MSIMMPVPRPAGTRRFRSPWSAYDVADEKLRPEAFLERTGLDYTVEKRPSLFDVNGEVTTVPNQFHLVRSSDNHVVSPSTVSKSYGVITPSMVVENVLKTFYDAGFGNFCAGFQTRNGSREHIAFRLDFGQDNDILENPLPSDSWENYLVITNSHGGSKLEGGLHRLRRVCSNGLHVYGYELSFGIRHTGDVRLKLETVRQNWQAAREVIAKQNAMLEKLAATQCDVRRVIEDILGISGKIAAGQKVSAQLETKRDPIESYAKRADMGADGRTLYAVLNGFTAFASHDAWQLPEEDDGTALLDSMLGGTRDREVERAYEALASLVA